MVLHNQPLWNRQIKSKCRMKSIDNKIKLNYNVVELKPKINKMEVSFSLEAKHTTLCLIRVFLCACVCVSSAKLLISVYTWSTQIATVPCAFHSSFIKLSGIVSAVIYCCYFHHSFHLSSVIRTQWSVRAVEVRTQLKSLVNGQVNFTRANWVKKQKKQHVKIHWEENYGNYSRLATKCLSYCGFIWMFMLFFTWVRCFVLQ